MKTLIVILILGSSFPLNAFESIGDRSNREAYESQKGYVYEKKCLFLEIHFCSFWRVWGDLWEGSRAPLGVFGPSSAVLRPSWAVLGC